MEAIKHWEYFINIEQDLVNSSRYVYPSTENWDTYSIQFEQIIQLSCSEIDTVGKLICEERGYEVNKQTGMKQLMNNIMAEFPEFYQLSISARRYGLVEFSPWKSWAEEVTPDWWTSYNEVKHSRADHFEKANLENALKSAAGLMGMIMYYLALNETEFVQPFPEIFNHHHERDTYNSAELGIKIKTPDNVRIDLLTKKT